MKRIIWYAAAAGIFISSALAKPSHGAMLQECVPPNDGSTEMCRDVPGLYGGNLWDWLAGFQMPGSGTYGSDWAQEKGAEWFPGQGLTVNGSCGQGPGNSCPGDGQGGQEAEADGRNVGSEGQNTGSGGQSAGSNHYVTAGGDSQGTEWFPGQGPSSNGDCAQNSGNFCPGAGQGSQNPGSNNHAATGESSQGAEWFPGQGPSSNGDCVQTPGNLCPGAGQGSQNPGSNNHAATGESSQGIEWFPGQGPSSNGDCAQNSGNFCPGAGQGGQGAGTGNQNAGNCGGDFGWLPWLPELPDMSFPWLPGQGGGNQGGTQGGPQTWLPNGDQNQNQNSGQGSDDQNNHQGGQGNTGGDQGSASYVTRIAELVNQERAAAGLSPVTVSAQLTAAANIRAREIVSNFAHYRPNGTYFNTVLTQNNISYRKAGENIAYGYDTPERVMTEWMNSPSHRANILTDVFTTIGIGYYQDGNGVKYWTQLFTY